MSMFADIEASDGSSSQALNQAIETRRCLNMNRH